jgi:hypothetical protein
MDPFDAEVTRARESAAAALGALPGLEARSEIRFEIGYPELVYSPDGRAAYSLVPGLFAGQIQAIVRVYLDGRVATVGQLKAPAQDCASAVTGLSASGASRLTSELAAKYPGAEISSPILVHDGPVAREAWMHSVKNGPAINLWIFSTAGGTYSRPAGEFLK